MRIKNSMFPVETYSVQLWRLDRSTTPNHCTVCGTLVWLLASFASTRLFLFDWTYHHILCRYPLPRGKLARVVDLKNHRKEEFWVSERGLENQRKLSREEEITSLPPVRPHPGGMASPFYLFSFFFFYTFLLTNILNFNPCVPPGMTETTCMY